MAALARCRDGDPQRAVEAIGGGGAAAPPPVHRHQRHPPQAQAPHDARARRSPRPRRWVAWARETLGPDAEIEFSAEDASPDRGVVPARGLRGRRRGGRLDGQHPGHRRLRHPGRVRRGSSAASSTSSAATRPSASTATTTSASRRRTRWPPSRRVPARSRSPSTASASAPATRRLEEVVMALRTRPDAVPGAGRRRPDRADHPGVAAGVATSPASRSSPTRRSSAPTRSRTSPASTRTGSSRTR